MNNLLKLFFTIIGVFFCIFIHELGHLTAGKVVKIEFQNMFVYNDTRNLDRQTD